MRIRDRLTVFVMAGLLLCFSAKSSEAIRPGLAAFRARVAASFPRPPMAPPVFGAFPPAPPVPGRFFPRPPAPAAIILSAPATVPFPPSRAGVRVQFIQPGANLRFGPRIVIQSALTPARPVAPPVGLENVVPQRAIDSQTNPIPQSRINSSEFPAESIISPSLDPPLVPQPVDPSAIPAAEILSTPEAVPAGTAKPISSVTPKNAPTPAVRPEPEG